MTHWAGAPSSILELFIGPSCTVTIPTGHWTLVGGAWRTRWASKCFKSTLALSNFEQLPANFEKKKWRTDRSAYEVRKRTANSRNSREEYRDPLRAAYGSTQSCVRSSACSRFRGRKTSPRSLTVVKPRFESVLSVVNQMSSVYERRGLPQFLPGSARTEPWEKKKETVLSTSFGLEREPAHTGATEHGGRLKRSFGGTAVKPIKIFIDRKGWIVRFKRCPGKLSSTDMHSKFALRRPFVGQRRIR